MTTNLLGSYVNKLVNWIITNQPDENVNPSNVYTVIKYSLVKVRNLDTRYCNVDIDLYPNVS